MTITSLIDEINSIQALIKNYCQTHGGRATYLELHNHFGQFPMFHTSLQGLVQNMILTRLPVDDHDVYFSFELVGNFNQ